MKISVVVPVYNTGKYLRECIDSLTTQTVFGDMELIFVDDGSSDGSPAICDEYAERYGNIKVIHKQNGGVSSARNAGLDAARGDYVGFADSDDIVYKDMYRLLFEAAEKTGADMTFCGIEHPYPDKDVIIEYTFEYGVPLGREYIKRTVAPFMIADSSFNSLCNKLFRRRVIEENGLRLTVGKNQGEDREFVLRFLISCGTVCSVPYTGYYYRYVQTSAVQKPRYDYADTILAQREQDRGLFSKLGVEAAQFERLSAVSTASQLICALAFANGKLKGRDRIKVMRSIVNNPETQKLIDDNFSLLMEQNTRFNDLLIKMMRKKSIAGIRFIMFLMKVKVSVYGFIKGGAQ